MYETGKVDVLRDAAYVSLSTEGAMMAENLESVLRARFEELGVGHTQQEWSVRLGNVDKATLSRILRGALPLTSTRAAKWAGYLDFKFSEERFEFARRLLDAASRQEAPRRNVTAFFEDMINGDGTAPAETISELFEALASDELEKVLVCCEYRDIPGAGPNARNENLAPALARAIAAKMSFAMFQPFGDQILLPESGKPDRPPLNAALYMMKVRTKCIDTYNLFRSLTVAELDNDGSDRAMPNFRKLNQSGEHEEGIDANEFQRTTNARSVNDSIALSRVQLYERVTEPCFPYLGSGIQGRMFYIRYTTINDGKNHARVMQWVSGPTHDILVYRGQLEGLDEAMKDSFYPIPHFFESPVGRLPLTIDYADHGGPGVRKYLKRLPGGEGLPEHEGARSLWKNHG